jgi:GNAT superfamily N-acetyltransferase
VFVRAAVPADAASIAEVHTRSWQGGYRGLLPQDYLDSIDVAARADRWRRSLSELDRPRFEVLVAELDGVISGFTDVCPSNDPDADPSTVGEIRTMYVRPDAWGTGCGQALMAAAADALRTAGYQAARLWVLDGNARAIRFYEASGWHDDAATKVAEIGGVPILERRFARTL